MKQLSLKIKPIEQNLYESSQMKRTCLICGGNQHQVVFREFEIDILRCCSCGHVFSTHPGEKDYCSYWGEGVTESEAFLWWDQAHRKVFDLFCKKFISGKNGKLLDVGCGLGYFVKKVSSYPNWEVFGYEISRAAVDYARNNLGLKNVLAGRVEESQFPPQSFDIITLWDVLEHIPQPDSLLGYLNSLLKEGGILFIHTPNIAVQLPKARLKKLLKGMNPEVHYLEAKDHMHIYSMKNLEKLLLRNSFARVDFIHLPPIQAVSGKGNWVLILVKNLWYFLSLVLFKVSFGRLNFDNLFAVAIKHYKLSKTI